MAAHNEDSTHYFPSHSRTTLKALRFANLGDVDHLPALKHAKARIESLMENEHNGTFSTRGYVTLINGSYGVGKTTATWALLNEIEDSGIPIFKIERSLIPFGNATGAISTFLNLFAERLWGEGVVDIREEINQFIFEVAPQQSALQVSANIGPVQVSRSFNSKAHTKNVDEIVFKKFAEITKVKGVFVVLDDIDRLRQSEIVEIMRLVEKLRTLPHVMVLLPAYKDIVTEAFQAELRVPGDAAATFIRKLTDDDITLHNNFVHLKRHFTEQFDGRDGTVGDMPISEYCWYVLLHNVIIREAIARTDSGNVVVSRLFEPTESHYLTNLKRQFNAQNRLNEPQGEGAEPYPAHFMTDQNEEKFAPLGYNYRGIAGGSDDNAARRELESLRDIDHTMRLVTLDTGLSSSMHSNPILQPFDQSLEASNGKPAMTAFFIPELTKSADEPLMTNNYRPREVIDIANRILGDHSFQGTQNFGTLYAIVRKRFDEYR